MKRKTGTICIILGLLLIAAALGLVGYNIWDDARAGQASAAVAEELLEVMPAQAEPARDDELLVFEPETEEEEESHIGDQPVEMAMAVPEMRTTKIQEYTYIGMIEVPSLEISLPVMDTWDYTRLEISPCRYSGSCYSHDLVICAHNYDKHFGPLLRARPGMDVYFSTVDGKVYHYQISNVEELAPTSVERITNPGGAQEWDLTLFTCYLGGRTRCTVRCVRV
jgi:Sortase (surface protein transpeptidase)